MINEWIKKGLMGVGALVIGLSVLGAIFDGGDDADMYAMDNSMYFSNPENFGAQSGPYVDESMYYSDESMYSAEQFSGYGNGGYKAYPSDLNSYYDGQGNYEYNTRWGGGTQSSDGSWSHNSNLAGGTVGGTSDGCIYTNVGGGWSNC